jgi:hypothetical protein
LVAGALAGNKLTGGLFAGAAPSAQLIDVQYSRASYLASIAMAFARPDIDVINRSGGGLGSVFVVRCFLCEAAL